MKKVKVYIDWYNLYHSINNQFWHKGYYWINYNKLLQNYITEDEEIIGIDYYTAYCERNDRKKDRHIKLVKLLRDQNIRVILWKYIRKSWKYTKNKPINEVEYSDFVIREIAVEDHSNTIPNMLNYVTREEKWTDVDMALAIVWDWLTDVFDRAIIVSGDSDFLPAIKKVRRMKQDKIFTSLLLAKTKGKAIRRTCDEALVLSEVDIAQSILEDEVELRNWTILTKPNTRSKEFTV